MKSKVVSIHQPNYIPWLGYFAKIAQSDAFVLLDDVQYVKGTVSNRNFILNSNAEKFLLSVPVKISKGSLLKYNEISISYQEKWQNKHLATIKNNYRKAPFFNIYFSEFENIIQNRYENLSLLNTEIIIWAMSVLNINTNLYKSSDIEGDKGKNNHLNLFLVKSLNGTHYLSGSGAKAYNDEEVFNKGGIELIYQDYKAIPYKQLYGQSFVENLSVLDAIFNLGPDAKELL